MKLAATLRDQAYANKGFVTAGSSYPSDTPSPLCLAFVCISRDRGRNIFEIGSLTRSPLDPEPWPMPKFKENVSLAKFTNYKIGGRARFFFEAKTEADVRWAVGEARTRKIACFILGGGTNLLIDDAGFNGLVLRVTIGGIIAKKNLITAGAGVPMSKLTAAAAKKSLAGLDWAGGLPGTLGGAIRGNAGCFGGEIKDSVQAVKSFDTKTMRSVTRNRAQCRFDYRTSIFKQHPGEIIISATLRMKKGDRKKISAALNKGRLWRASRHPLEYPSAGSVFKNVSLAEILRPRSKPYRIAVKNLAVHYRGSSFSVKTDPVPVIAAAKLIGESGLSGKRCGGAMISPKHTNFIVNTKHAKAREVLHLISLVQKRVHRKFGIRLEPEIQIVPREKKPVVQWKKT